MSLQGLVRSGAEFIALSPESAAPYVLHAARAISTNGLFRAMSLLEKSNGENGMNHEMVPVYDDVSPDAVSAAVDCAVQRLLSEGKLVQAHTHHRPGWLRVVPGNAE